MELKIPTMKSLQALPWGKIIIGLIILYIIWQTTQGKTLFEILGMSKPSLDKDSTVEKETQATITDASGNKETVPISSDIKILVEEIKRLFEDSTAMPFGSLKGERCELCGKMLTINDKDLIIADKLYNKAYGKTIHAALSGVYENPCGYWYGGGPESNYEKARTKLANLKTY